MSSGRGRAPGRLDLMGGVADYSGALVLEIPTRQGTEVVAEPDDALVVGPVTIPVDELERLARHALPLNPTSLGGVSPLDALRARGGARPCPSQSHSGATSPACDFVRSPGVRGRGLERRARSGDGARAGRRRRATALGLLVPGSRELHRWRPMRRHGPGRRRGGPPRRDVAHSVSSGGGGGERWPAVGLEVVGWPTGAEHDVGGLPYRRARAAAFMGKRIVEARARRTWAWTSELPPTGTLELPEDLDGATFMERWGDTDDALTLVDPGESYPVRAAATFGVEEHARSLEVLAHLRRGRDAISRPR